MFVSVETTEIHKVSVAMQRNKGKELCDLIA